MRALPFIILVAAVLLPTQAMAYIMAYIDPGTGSAIISGIIGFLVAVATATKIYWYKIKSLFTKQASEKETSDN